MALIERLNEASGILRQLIAIKAIGGGAAHQSAKQASPTGAVDP
jgi:hypothetical protein